MQKLEELLKVKDWTNEQASEASQTATSLLEDEASVKKYFELTNGHNILDKLKTAAYSNGPTGLVRTSISQALR